MDNMISRKKTRNTSIGVMLKKDFIRNRSLYIMALPVVAFFIIFKYVPMYGVLMAFQDYSPQLGIWGSKWVGLKHFISFFQSPSFIEVLGNTLRISLVTLLFTFPTPIILALMLNEVRHARFSKLIQNMTYIPHFISLVVTCGLIHIFTANTGIIGGFFAKYFDMTGSMLMYPQYFLPIYVTSAVWGNLGWDSIIYLAALTGVDASLHEAAEIDGANRWQRMIHVTIPGIMPTIIIMLLLKLGGVLNVGFEKILLLYNDSTMMVADVISTYVYRRGLINLDWSYSTAVNLFNSVVNLIFLLGSQIISRRVSGYSLW